jgi:hypothetical protein
VRKLSRVALASFLLVALASPALADKLSKGEWKKLEDDVTAWSGEKPHDAGKAKDLVYRIAKDQSARAVLAIAKVVEIQDEDALALDAGAAIASMDADPARKEAQKQATSAKAWRVRLACVQASGEKITAKGARAVVEKALEDAQADVAIHAVRILAKDAKDDVVDPLIARMEKLDKERGPVWEELRETLGELLQRRLPSGAEYRSLWAELKTKGGLSAATPQEEPEPAPGGAGGLKTVSLFGREVACTRVVFILDISESMTAVDDPNIEVPPDGTRSSPAKGDKPPADPRSRIERAKRELKKVLRGLPPAARFNLIAFSTATRLWRGSEDGKPPRLQECNDKNREEAFKFIDTLEANGTTATDDALERAFQIEGARCFYLLSDGEPTKDGKNRIPTETILDLIAKHNEKRHVRIHTLGFVGADPEFMRAVSKATNGKYSDIK